MQIAKNTRVFFRQRIDTAKLLVASPDQTMKNRIIHRLFNCNYTKIVADYDTHRQIHLINIS